MLLTLVDLLRCPAPHEASSLVLAADAWAGGRVTRGELGCPVCRARYPIRDGVADFSGRPAPDEAVTSGTAPPPFAADEAGAVRLAAQLDLGDSGGVILLAGSYAGRAGSLAQLVEVSCLLVDHHGPIPPGAVAMLAGERLPLADGVLRGAAIDGARVNALADVVRVVRPGGRLVAPSPVQPPDRVVLVARDEDEWVASIPPDATITRLARSPRSR